MQIYDVNVVLHGIPGVEPGIESVQKFYQGSHEAFPGVQIKIEDLVTGTDKLACRFTISGTHGAEFMGIPPTSKSMKCTGITNLKFHDGKCVEMESS
ncbi:MAG: ester cyclase [Thermoproteota archaeon]|nr:ester cyclase [Thermoproteota archaeon]